MKAALKRATIEMEDWLRGSRLLRGLISRYQVLRAGRPDAGDPQAVARSILRLCSAARLAPGTRRLIRIEEAIRRCVDVLDWARLDWREFLPEIDFPWLGKAALLKPWIGPREKGVIFVSFEDQWARLLRLPNLREFAERYTLVVAPSWSPPHALVNYVFPRAYPDPFFALISNQEDLETLPRLSEKYRPVPLYASSWVNPDFFHPLPPHERNIDLLMLANWGKFKRQHALFRAVHGLPAGTRVAIIGREQDGRTIETVRQEARYYGVADRVTLINDLRYPQVIEHLCRTRASVILSRREGSCVAVAESLFADAPVAMLHDAHVGSRAFINDATGRLLDDGDLGSQLADFLATLGQYTPRRWAEQNISCLRSTNVLNDTIKAEMLRSGQEWTHDLAPLCWCSDPALVYEEDRQRLEPELYAIKARFGIDIGEKRVSPAPIHSGPGQSVLNVG